MKKLLLIMLAAVAVMAGCKEKKSNQNATIRFTRADISGAEYLTLAQDPAAKASGTTEVQNTLFKIDDKGKMTAVTFYVQTTYDKNGNQTGEVDATANYSVIPSKVTDYGEKYVLFSQCEIQSHNTEASRILDRSDYRSSQENHFLIRKTDGAIFRINPDDIILFPIDEGYGYGRNDKNLVYNAKGDLYMANNMVSKLKLVNDKLTLQRLTQHGESSTDELLLDKYDNFYGGDGTNGFILGGTLHFANGSLMEISRHNDYNGYVILIDNELYGVVSARNVPGLNLYKLPTTMPADLSNPNYELIATIDDRSFGDVYRGVETYELENEVIIDGYIIYNKATKTLSTRDFPYNEFRDLRFDKNGIAYKLQDNKTEIIKYNIFDLSKKIIPCDRSAVPPFIGRDVREEKTEFIEYGLKNSDGNPIRVHTDKAIGKVTVYEDPDKRTITELIKVS